MAAGPVHAGGNAEHRHRSRPRIGVAVLAVVSLLMMATMVKKSAPPPLVMPTSLAESGSASAGWSEAEISSLAVVKSVAGEVGAGIIALDGMEMDEDAVTDPADAGSGFNDGEGKS